MQSRCFLQAFLLAVLGRFGHVAKNGKLYWIRKRSVVFQAAVQRLRMVRQLVVEHLFQTRSFSGRSEGRDCLVLSTVKVVPNAFWQ